MKTLDQMNFNFRTIENTIKTIGTMAIIACSIALIISMAINPTSFNF